MSYVIAGRHVKNEYLALGTLGVTFGGVFAYRSMSSSKPVVPKPAATTSHTDSDLGVTTDSKDELDFIRKYIADAEKDEKKGGH